MTFAPAKRTGIVPLVGLFGKSFTGKSYSALLLMRGLIGPKGRMGAIDTEGRRLSINVGREAGDFEVLDMEAPFTPEKYCEAMDLAFEAKFDGLLIDSASHEWFSYLEIKQAWIDERCGDDWKKADKLALAAAAKCKPAHNRFVAKLLRSPIPIILCFRGKDKVQMGKDDRGKTTIIQPEHSSPIQDSGLIYEMLIAGETLNLEDDSENRIGCFRPTKWTHPDLLHCLPREGEQIGIKHGQAIAQWCANPGGSPKLEPKEAPKAAKSPKAQLWDIMKREGQSPYEFSVWAIENDVMADTEELSGLSDKRMAEVLEKTKTKLDIV